MPEIWQGAIMSLGTGARPKTSLWPPECQPTKIYTLCLTLQQLPWDNKKVFFSSSHQNRRFKLFFLRLQSHQNPSLQMSECSDTQFKTKVKSSSSITSVSKERPIFYHSPPSWGMGHLRLIGLCYHISSWFLEPKNVPIGLQLFDMPCIPCNLPASPWFTFLRF